MVAVLCIFFVAPFLWLSYACITAKPGWEDSGGFHRGIKSYVHTTSKPSHDSSVDHAVHWST